MTSRKDWFADLQDKENSQILLGDDHTVEVQGIVFNKSEYSWLFCESVV